MSPTERTIKLLRLRGYVTVVVSHYEHHSRQTKDLCGADVMGLKLRMPALLIQTTSGSHHADRLKKSIANPLTKLWLETGNKFEVWSHAKRGARGERKTWICRMDALVAPALFTPDWQPDIISKTDESSEE